MFFFDERYQTFEMFTFPHFAAWIVVVVLFGLMLLFRKHFTGKLDLILRRTIALLMISMEWIFYGWALSNGGFQTSLLPFGACALSMYITSYALWTKNEKVFQIVFPWAVAGALISLVVADMNYNFPHFRYIHFFGNHSLFLLGNLYLLLTQGFHFNYRHLLKSSLVLLIYVIIIYPINFLLDSNHLFLRELPIEVAPMYQVFGSFWVLGFITSIFILFHIIYIPVGIRNRSINKKNKSMEEQYE